jgi:hypothetical protein
VLFNITRFDLSVLLLNQDFKDVMRMQKYIETPLIAYANTHQDYISEAIERRKIIIILFLIAFIVVFIAIFMIVWRPLL